MRRKIVSVRLCSNGAYWQGSYVDAAGNRKKFGIGPKRDMSRRQATVECQRKSNEFTNCPSMMDAGKAPRLGEFVEKYVKGRTDLGPGSVYLYTLTGKYLTAFFGADVRIDEITKARARDWRTALQSRTLPGCDEDAGKQMSETTACNYCKYAKSMFNQAVDDDLIPLNPFAKLKSTAPDPDRTWHYLPLSDLETLLEACPSDGWRAMLGLCRLAGLRRGEAVALPWSAVDWERKRLTVFASKTAKSSDGGKRVIPITSRLYEILLRTFERAEPSERVCNIEADNLRGDFKVIRKRAGLDEWAEPFQVMRRNCETDWAKTCPQHAVSEWIGHDITVSAKFYLNVSDDVYARVSGETAVGQNPSDMPQNTPQLVR